jgi:hypothetical protein
MTITAKFAGHCQACGGTIQPGQKIEWARGAGSRHTKCRTEETKTPVAEGSIKLHGGSGYGCHGWVDGNVLLSSEERRRAGGPDGLMVVSASRQYIREDGMCFGVGDDDGYLYTATCRAATAAELAPLVDELCYLAYRDEARKNLDQAVTDIKALGETPTSPAWPAGEVLYDTATGYGHGQAIVIGEAGIWVVEHNGADGDDWSVNNLPGCVGWRVDTDAAMTARLRDMAVRAGMAKPA